MDDELKRIAARIRTWRDEAGMTLQQLGDKSGVSASTIHKIENLQTVPTIAVLLKVAAGLGRRPSELLADANPADQVGVMRASDRQVMQINSRGEIEHLIEMIPRNRIDCWRVRLDPDAGAGLDGEPWQFSGEIAILVESGEIEVEVGNEAHKISAGDSIHFDTSAPHKWFASGGAPATLMILALLPERMQGDLMSRIAMSTGIQPTLNKAI